MRTATFLLVALVVSMTNAFVVPVQQRSLSSSQTSQASTFGSLASQQQQFSNTRTTTTSNSSLSAKKASTKEKAELDYGMIVGMFFNPLNPYSWFVYLFSFIIIYGTINGGN